MQVKRYVSTNGIDILVGLDDESNDKLTLKTGHANDLWFHVSGSPGSHVILRCGESENETEKADLKDAAALAAWFSKMRYGGNVTVNYCLLKNVTKPRGAKPGTVSIRKAKKIKVQPKLLPASP
jgi:predicted ribosome quality control (RQC) complex YloA/Tae2 family protein